MTKAILVVDDEERVRSLLRQYLAREGLRSSPPPTGVRRCIWRGKSPTSSSST